MLKFQWKTLTINSHSDFEVLKRIVEDVKPEYGAIDTETDGLHIKESKPFLIQFGFLDEKRLRGYTFAIDLENNPEAEDVLTYWESVAHTLKIYMGQNIKFDLHMLANIGHEYRDTNLSDTMFYIRYGHDALHPEEGGPPLGLKEYATKYITRDAKLHENKLTREKTDIAKMYNNRLKHMLNQSGAKVPEGFKDKSFTLKVINEMFKDCIFDISDLPEDMKEPYLDWLHSLPLYLQHKVQSLVQSDMIRYNDLNRENLITYAHYDIIYTLEIWASLRHIIENRQQEQAIYVENRCILPWYDMECTGFHADREYLEESRRKLKAYIQKQRSEFYELAGQKLAISQHATLKKILREKFNLEIDKTNDETLSLLKTKLDEDNPAHRFITLLQELRTMEKWYAVYILRFQKELRNTDYLYTTINQVGTVSGRITSDFQQFPKKGIKTEDGEEIFHPRRVIKTNSALVYLDYSQIELRFQALYTILLGKPDMNMCRAYMPFECYRITEDPDELSVGTRWGITFKMTSPAHIKFDPSNSDHIKHYKDYKWYHCEDGTEWEPVDVHGATTLAAFPGLKKTDPEFHDLRYVGKRVNFAKNYGAELSRIKQMFPEKTHEECVMINDAYYKAFPGIKNYHEYCNERAAAYSNTENLFHVRYYNVSGHKLKNMLIQGSAAFFLKWKIVQLYDYMQKNNIKTRFQMQIHDELSWEYDPSDPPEIFFKFKEIMEDWPAGEVPVIADMEVTTSTWADKVEVENIDELKEIIK